VSELENLFSTVTINSLELANRAVMPAMGTGYGDLEGNATDRLATYLARRAKGGAGLLITEVCAVDRRGKGFPSEIGAWSDDLIPGLAKIADAVHGAGGRVALQLHHAGRETFEAFAGGPPEAPSPIPSPTMMQPCVEMDTVRIAEVVEAYAQAAERAREAGLDAVEIHGAHGYLINQFLSPLSNERTDEYGGSDENRARFAIEVVAAVREKVGPSFPVIIRVSTDEVVRGGYELEFMLWLAPLLVQAGVDAIHASVGVSSTPGQLTIASMDTDPGFNLFRARALKQVVSVPVIGVGRINDPRLADEAIEVEDADLISFGRQHLTDPDFLTKARKDAFEDIIWCLACNQGCIERLALELKPVTCTINPACGEEKKAESSPAETKLHVWVVGGGPAGVSAALSASSRAHTVELFERGTELGGQLLPASRPPAKKVYMGWLEWAERQLEKSGVTVHLGQSVTGDSVQIGNPDYVVLATGADPWVPDIPGIDHENVVDARELLLGRVTLASKVLILGAGPTGMETADYLAARGIKPTLLEMSEAPSLLSLTAHGYWLHKRLKEVGGTLILGAKVTRIEDGAVYYEKDGVEQSLEPAGPIVTALGARSADGLREELDKLSVPYVAVGDASSPRRLLEAVHEGYWAGLNI
jgi:2,4-dienoyl-CoA reductase-like NADH-dependent reductase (Old Yellow Enzyme family)